MITKLPKTDAKLAKVSKLLNATAVDRSALNAIKLAIFDVAITAIGETAEEINSGAKTLSETADVAIRKIKAREAPKTNVKIVSISRD